VALVQSDAIGRFITEKCERHPQARVELKVLYPAYKKFCDASGEPRLSEKAFSQRLEGHKLVKGNDSRSRRACFRGITSSEQFAWSEGQIRDFVANRKTANPHLCAAVGLEISSSALVLPPRAEDR
jgi:phage/plasmid-associated DNA primase